MRGKKEKSAENDAYIVRVEATEKPDPFALFSFACMYLLAGGEIYKLSRNMGHSRVEVTEIYLRAIKDMQLRNGPSVLDLLKEAK